MSEQSIIHNPQPSQEGEPEIASQKLTVEVGLIAAVGALALAVRLYRLDLAPLSSGEAGLALAAFRGALPPAGASPLLTWLDMILFAVFGSSDFAARLMPALAGAALALLPFLMRERLGRAGALGAALVLAISPVAIFTSRTASGETFAAAAMLGLLAAGEQYLRRGRAGWLYTCAALLGVGLASGRTIYSALLILLVGLGLWAAGQGRQLRYLVSNPQLKTALAVLAAAFLIAATGFGGRMNGLGATADLLSAWLADFAGTTQWAWPFQVLIIYEGLALAAGIVGAFVALQRRARSSVVWLVWLLAALVLAALRPGHTGGDVLLAVVPLALLSGYAFDALARSRRDVHFGVEEGGLIVVLMPVMGYFILGLVSYANNPGAPAPSIGASSLGQAFVFIQPLLAISLGVILVALVGAISTTEAAVRGAMTAVLIALALGTWSAGWGAAQAHPGDPREIIAGPQTTSLDVRDLTRDLARLSADKTLDTMMLPISVLSPPNSVLAWYLRQMPYARFVTSIEGPAAPSAFITADRVPTLSSSYAGEEFTMQHEWRLDGKSSADMIKWLFYRKADPPRPTLRIVLWVKQGQ
jgi:4-amino-4-deoxy-L-arabinose transferase-like glycosyltransferase